MKLFTFIYIFIYLCFLNLVCLYSLIYTRFSKTIDGQYNDVFYSSIEHHFMFIYLKINFSYDKNKFLVMINMDYLLIYSNYLCMSTSFTIICYWVFSNATRYKYFNFLCLFFILKNNIFLLQMCFNVSSLLKLLDFFVLAL